MRILCTLFSIAYIVAIFLFAGSPVVSDLAPFNPYSLLHIPLYGILTVLLIFSFAPIKLNRVRILPGVISLIVGIVDEIHQSFIPTRNASIIDVFLDALGILLALFVIVKFYRKKESSKTHLAQS